MEGYRGFWKGRLSDVIVREIIEGMKISHLLRVPDSGHLLAVIRRPVQSGTLHLSNLCSFGGSSA